jgi:hypothetical protein
MTATELASFLGWCTVLNLGLLILSTIMLIIARRPIVSLHSRLFDTDPSELPKLYMDYLSRYKGMVIVFNLVPYLALRLMGV